VLLVVGCIGGLVTPQEGTRGIWRTDQSGTRPEKITPDTYEVVWCAWRPDGREIAFEKAAYEPADTEREHGKYSIAFMDPGKPGVIKREIRLADNVADGQYSPDGRWLSVQMVQMQDSPLAVINLKTEKLQPIFYGDAAGLFPPKSRSWIDNYTWLSDSQHLLVTMVDDQNRSLHQIWLINLKGEARKLAEGGLVWGRADGRLLVIMKDKRFWKVELGAGKVAPTAKQP
jgi:dipeptidyl aminopeptidase/acylaminoacyl peptidase